MAHEIELKLTLRPEDQTRFMRLPLLRTALRRESTRLINRYYDTPDLALRRRGVALRTRRQGKRWLQTVKCSGESAAGLSNRPEWEAPYDSSFDFAMVDAPALRSWLESHLRRDNLVPMFEINFRRTTWHLQPTADCLIQLSLDRGQIIAGERSADLCEVELELQQGQATDLFDFAQRLATHLCLVIENTSKAERGYRIALNHTATPIKHRAVPLNPQLSPLAAFQRIAFACLDHLQQNYEGAVLGVDAEYIHQMRIATRCLRAALRLFAPLLPADFDQLRSPLHTLVTALGQARDMDVMASEIVAPVLAATPQYPGLAALSKRLTQRREQTQKQAVSALTTPSYGQWLLLAARLLHGLGGNEHPAQPSLGDFSEQRLSKLSKRLTRSIKAAGSMEPAALHTLRIGAKRMRYSLEFLSPVFRHKQRTALHRRLSRAQDILGMLNDLTTSDRHLHTITGKHARLRAAADHVMTWHERRQQQLSRKLPKLLESLRDHPQLQRRKSWT